MNAAVANETVHPASSYRYAIVDVFTDTAFGGNQLAVFPDATGLSTASMQKIAREFNFAESTFVIPATGGGPPRLRIFTPRVEMPFAGHPTVGTAAVMSYLGLAPPQNHDGLVIYDEGIGPVAVRVAPSRGRTVFAEFMLEASLERPEQVPDRGELAAALSLSQSAVLDTWFAAVGIPFCFVHLASRETVDAAVLDRHAWNATLARGWAPQIFIFSGSFVAGATLHARMFAPAFGIEEDPATGSACVALVATLAERIDSRDGEVALTIHQGVLLGRPSIMNAFAVKRGGATRQVRLGGNSVIVAEGYMTIATETA